MRVSIRWTPTSHCCNEPRRTWDSPPISRGWRGATNCSTSSWARKWVRRSAPRHSLSSTAIPPRKPRSRVVGVEARVALRFELYHRGVELANGYHELASGAEQRVRFAADQKVRAARGLPTFAIDPHLLSALDAGLPDCAGVALGFDRVLMLAMGASNIDDVLAFPVERA